MVKNTTGKPVSVDALTSTRSHNAHADNAMELCWKHAGIPRSRGSLLSLRKTVKRDRGDRGDKGEVHS